LLANDTDADADTLTALLVTGPTHGSLTFHLDGSFSYIPDANFSGTDRFTYRANDGNTLSDVATVNITVTSANDAPVANDDFTSTNEDTPVVIDVISNDSDVDGSIDPTSVTITGQPNHGLLQVDSVTGAISYTPALDFFGSDVFRYRVTDTVLSLSNIATVLVTVKPVNDAPRATQDSYVVLEDTPQNVAAVEGLLANDNDVDGYPITALLLTGPARGILTLNVDGSFRYTPAANFVGSDSFVYAASDEITQSASATVSFTILSVNDAPSVTPLSDYVIPAGSVLTRSGSFSDADADDSWTATVDYGDGSGVQSLALTGTTYALNHDYAGSGTYSVTVIVTDDQGASGSDTATVTVGNLPPVVNAGADQVAGEGATIQLTVNVSDPGSADTHTSIIDWGDGTNPEIAPVTDAAGTSFISVNHIYVDNGVYTVAVRVTDDGGASAADTLTVTVSNAVPQTDGGPDRTIQEGELVRFPSLLTSEIFDAAFGTLSVTQFTGSFRDPGALDTHTGNIDWGDGTTAVAPIVEQSFSAPSSRAGSNGVVLADHSYGDNGVYTVVINVTDKDGGQGTDHLAITVLNVAPTVDAGLDHAVDAGVLFKLSADFRDPGVLDSHTAVIDWGDGTFDPAVIDSAITGGLRIGTATGSHVYTSSGLFTARVIVTDDDGGSNSDSLLVNVAASSTALSITAKSADKAEGNNGLTPFTFTVVRSGDVSGTTLVDFAVSGEGPHAADAADFGGLLPGGQLNFQAGEVSHTITIFVRGDGASEPDEAFRVTLSNATGAAEITTASDIGTIRNDEVVAGFSLDCSPLHVGLNTCTILGATLGGVVDLALGLQPGNRYMPQFGVTLGMLDPTIVAQGIVQPDGRAIVQVNVSTPDLLQRLLFEAFEQAPLPRTTNIVSIGTPLQSAGGQGPDAVTMSASDFYSMLTAIRSEAIARWSEMGLSSAETSLLHSASIEVADLADGLLGQTIDHRIFVDASAAGYGWFVDATSTDDAEFSLIVSAAERIAPPGTAAAEHVDLLTVLMHEYGHILGRTDLSVAQTTGLMTVTLPAGARRVPAWNPLDVNRDRTVSPLDALLVINHLNSTGSRHVDDVTSVLARLDVNSDRFISPLDALIIINALNSRMPLNGEGESSALGGQTPTARYSHSAAILSSPSRAFRGSTTFDTTATNQDRQVSQDHSMLIAQPAITIGVAAAHADNLFARSLYDESLVPEMLDDLLLALATDTHRSRIEVATRRP
jgi:VCBS repeat-containing protein